MVRGLQSAEQFYFFGPFRLDVPGRELLKGCTRLALGSRAFDILVALVSRQGELAAKADLMDQVWPGIAVSEGNLTTQVLNLRKLLSQHDPDTTYVVTDAGRGYRFVAPLRTGLPEMKPEPACAVAAPAANDGEHHNIPNEVNSFIGRTHELAEITRRLGQRALLTLVGSGGIGKTRCALRVAQDSIGAFPHGVWLVELAPLQDGALVAETLCRVLGLPVSGDRSAVDVCTAFLRARTALLVLDNCEHVLPATVQLVDALLKHCPRVKILVTSRENLGIDGEAVYRVPSLPLPLADPAITAAAALASDAVRLFVERAGDATGGYTLTDEDAPAVASICRRLDGVAMATELAAARLRMLKPAEIATRLEDMFRLLTGGSKAALPRQQTLRATIDWSYTLLSPAEQALLRRLSVFVGGFSLESAAAVCGGTAAGEGGLLELLTALVDKSLVLTDQSGTVTRYRMLTATCQYAYEKLQQSGEPDCMRRLATHLVGLLNRAEASWDTTPTAAWLADFGPEVENLRAAIDWAFGHNQHGARFKTGEGDPAIGIELVAAAGRMADEMLLLADMKRWTTAAIPHFSSATPKASAAWVLHWATRHQGVFGVRTLSETRLHTIALFRQAGAVHGLSYALRTAGLAMARPGEDAREARDMVTEAVALLRPLGRGKGLAGALASLGAFLYLSGDEEGARRASEEALEMRRALGDRTGELLSYINNAEFAFARGDAVSAVSYAVQAQRAARACQLQEVLATIRTNLANYLLYTNDLEGGRTAALEGLAVHRALGNEDYAVVCLEHLALAYALDGAPQHAARLFGYTDGYFRSTGQVRDWPEEMSRERLCRTLAASIPASRLNQLQQEGAGWSADQAAAAAVPPPVHMPPRSRVAVPRSAIAN